MISLISEATSAKLVSELPEQWDENCSRSEKITTKKIYTFCLVKNSVGQF